MLLKRNCSFTQAISVKAGLNIVLLAALLFLFQFSFSQTTNISGIVNTYHRVIEKVPAKAAVRVNSTTGLSLSQTVMIIQMKGATVTTTNSINFGNVTSLNDAGNYEIGVICGMRGDTVFLFHNLANTYTIAGKVQLVGMPTYYSALVTDTLKAQPWNNVTGTGGVIAINVEENLSLDKPIIADAVGFNGGDYVLSSGSCFDFLAADYYIYNASATGPQNGAYKGESIYDVTAGQSGGRAAVANGGGGGNNHNNAGGGGSNLSAGGNGGGNSSSEGCTVDLKGMGGKALNSAGGTKIFLGGGGGAGHSNANFTAPLGGGNGGGIIFITARNLISNGQRITANGGLGGGSVSDGASGGGGAGTIVTDIENFSGTLNMEARGGNGGLSSNGGNLGRCYGGGGGGSGGVIYFQGAVPVITISVAGGPGGIETGREATCEAMIPSVAGNAGSTVANYTYTRSVVPGNYCAAIPLPLGLIYFKAILNNTDETLLQWKISETPEVKKYEIERSGDKNNWSAIGTLTSITQKSLYEYIDKNVPTGISYYRLKITDANNKISYSAIQRINIRSAADKLIVYPNPAKESIIIEGELPVSTKIRLLSAEGKLITQKEIITNQQRMQFNLPALAAGIYFIQVNEVMKKIVVQE